MADDWLSAVEHEANLAKFDRMTGRIASTHDIPEGPDAPGSANCATPTRTAKTARDPSTKENESPAARRRRKLPAPSPGAKGANGSRMRRAQSLSFLPSVGDPNNDERTERTRRRLPDPGQGKLIQEVADKLAEEAQVRLDLARELKEERRKRWKLEDQVTELQGKCSKLQQLLEDKRRQCEQSQKNAEDERIAKVNAENRAEASQRELRRSRLELQRLKESQDSAADDAAYGEAALKDAWESTITEKKLRQEAQEQLEALKRGILASGGPDILKQLMQVGSSLDSELATPMGESPVPEGLLSPGMKYESSL